MNICTLHQWLWSRAHDSGLPLPAFSQKHISGCSGCRESIEAMRTVDDSLRISPAPLDEEWHAAVMRDIRRIPPPLKQPAPAKYPLRLALAGAAAIIAAVVFLKAVSPKADLPENSIAAEGESSVVSLTDLAFSLENESAALEKDVIAAARMATCCLPF
jgi:anti-sigma factor RsiW